MSFAYKTGQLTLNTSLGNQEIDSGTGLEGKAIRFTTSGQTAEGTAAETMGSIGIAAVDDSANMTQAAVKWASNDAANPNVSNMRYTTDRILFGEPPGSLNEEASFVSFGTGGNAGKFTINIDRAGSALLVYYEIWCGDDITADVVAYAAPTTGGERDDLGTLLGGDNIPEFAYSFGYFRTSAGVGSNASCWQGCSLSDAKRWAIAWGADDGATATESVKHYHTDLKAIAGLNVSPALDFEADFVSWEVGGRKLNWTDAAAAAVLYSTLYIKGGKIDVGDFAAPTAGGVPQDQPITTAVALDGISLHSAGNATAMATLGDEWGCMIGGGANPAAAQESVMMTKGQNTMSTDENGTNASTKCIRIIDPAVTAEADYKEQGGTSFTVTWTTIDATDAYKIFWFGVGPSAAPPAPTALPAGAIAGVA